MSHESVKHELSELRPLLVSADRAAELKQLARDFVSLDLSTRQAADLEMLGCGAYTPLAGYMCRAEYAQVRDTMRLSDGQFWPLPLALEISAAQAMQLTPGAPVALRDAEGFLLAVLHLKEIWRGDDERYFLGGGVEVVALPQHHDFLALRLTPQQVRARWRGAPDSQLFIFQAEDIVSPASFAELQTMARASRAFFLWQAISGELLGDEAAYFARIRAQQAQLEMAPADTALTVINLPKPGVDLRGALFKAVVARNYGATQVALGGVSLAALAPFQNILGFALQVVTLPQSYRQLIVTALALGEEIPEANASARVVASLRGAYPPRSERGYCVFFTGLSGAGKSTIAKALMAHLLENGARQVTLLDGDIVRKNLSSELGFSRAHRDLNVRRIGYVASEIVKHRGIAICAPIAPYQATRQDVREMIEQYGGFFEIYVATPLAVCEARDRKGLYAKARAGLVKEFTGISDPYEAPLAPAVSIDASNKGVETAVQEILSEVRTQGYLI